MDMLACPSAIFVILKGRIMNKTTNQDFFEVGIVEHCNLNCRGSSHFSPIAEPYYMDPDVFD